MNGPRRKHPILRDVPQLLLGFDTETTGLAVQRDRAISYGFAAYYFGELVWREQFFVRPDVPIAPAASRVHGLTVESFDELSTRAEVVEVATGAQRTLDYLRQFHEWGYTVVGANLWRFDLAMLWHTSCSALGEEVHRQGFSLDTLRVVDVIEHDRALDDDPTRRRRSLTKLCDHYALTPGGHDALGDAIASVEVLKAQVNEARARQGAFAIGQDGAQYGKWLHERLRALAAPKW